MHTFWCGHMLATAAGGQGAHAYMRCTAALPSAVQCGAAQLVTHAICIGSHITTDVLSKHKA